MAQTLAPPLSDAERNSLARAVADWSIAHGLVVRPPPSLVTSEAAAETAAICAPVTLFPSPFPRRCFDQAKAVQKTYNELYASVSRDEDFLVDMVTQVADGDDFIRNLWQTHLRVKKEGYSQPLSLGLFRSDYMVHEDESTKPPTLQLKQVEFNTIAASFGGLSHRTSLLHQYLADTEYPLLRQPIAAGSLTLPENEPIRGLAAGIRAAYDAYSASELGHATCVIFAVQGGERNIFDQRPLEYEIESASSPAIPVFRLAFADVKTHTSVADTPQRQLLYRHARNPSAVWEVAVIYMRAGYGPDDYPDQATWDARYHLERSYAIKCPSVLTQLAGAKKVQQVLATPKSSSTASVLARFIGGDDSPAAAQLRETFANIFPMDTSAAGLEARRRALDPELCKTYVLKPQREGGGNNTYRGAVPGFLKSVPEEHWASFILMELIAPPPVSNLILRNGRIEQGDVICELGVYGTCLWNQRSGELLLNEDAGYLLRTKGSRSEEGGVAAGYGCMDSCGLV
ncbi:glutathione synthetase-like protein [Ophiocordyceps camponoti-floridani]|uniref:Glutathione synthetase n=1 Tax=Ophiocordyceps camponoti-floridani TaxID=2030778 RepID=A0A8H4Q511_9HYPO|nr:glutathione synthetase-like protein [Ophiocordyceps camponoti-floridani]